MKVSAGIEGVSEHPKNFRCTQRVYLVCLRISKKARLKQNKKERSERLEQ